MEGNLVLFAITVFTRENQYIMKAIINLGGSLGA